MTEARLSFFQNTTGNIRQSQMAQDMNTHPNGEFFLQKGRIVARTIGDSLIAVNPHAGIQIPYYLKRIPAITSFRTMTA